ncbi:glutathione transferase GST 23-like [Diospyros lotus]|uniref:glutathione transferase GST 23-like n=1 Tax=Diospyros lotus TaxID=55363 RepID=UPI002253582C|nr:glutathione transferase GST 23-like [Diospyros lotus]
MAEIGEGEEVKLLGVWFSPFVSRVKWALKMKGIQYEYLEDDLANKSPLLLQSNPFYRKVPVLLHHAKPIAESIIILEYIDQIWRSNPILPPEPHQRALARFWAKFAEDKFTEVVRRVLLVDGEEKKRAEKEAQEALAVLEGELKSKGSKFFGGEAIGLVDLVMGWIAIWLEPIEQVSGAKVFDPEKFPSLKAWMEAFVELPLIQDCSPSKASLVPALQQVRDIALARSKKAH